MNHVVRCRECGAENTVQCNVEPMITKMAPRGSGWQGANKIKKLGWTRAQIVRHLQLKQAYDFSSGLTSRQIGEAIREVQKVNGKRYSTDHGIGGRVSELQGIVVRYNGSVSHIVISEEAGVELYDSKEQRYRTKMFTRYFLTQAGKEIPPDENFDPRQMSQQLVARF